MGRWLKGEPKLSEVLTDPVIQMMMRRDRVDPQHLHAFLRQVSERRTGKPSSLADLASLKGDAPPR